MRSHLVVASCWCALNFGLALMIPHTGPTPWVAIAVLAVLPLLLIVFARQVAAYPIRSVMARFASDFGKPQSPLIVMLIGWVVLIAETTVLVVKLLW